MVQLHLWYLAGQEMSKMKLAWKLKEKSELELSHNERVEYVLISLDNLMMENNQMSMAKFYELKEDIETYMAKMA